MTPATRLSARASGSDRWVACFRGPCPVSNRGEHFEGRESMARVALLLALFSWLMSSAVRAQDPPVEGLFLTVHNPITSDVTNRLKETTTRVVERWREGVKGMPAGPERQALKIVYDFNPD